MGGVGTGLAEMAGVRTRDGAPRGRGPTFDTFWQGPSLTFGTFWRAQPYVWLIFRSKNEPNVRLEIGMRAGESVEMGRGRGPGGRGPGAAKMRRPRRWTTEPDAAGRARERPWTGVARSPRKAAAASSANASDPAAARCKDRRLTPRRPPSSGRRSRTPLRGCRRPRRS